MGNQRAIEIRTEIATEEIERKTTNENGCFVKTLFISGFSRLILNSNAQ